MENKYIVKTSNLGYDISVYNVLSNMPLEKFQEIDSKYGMKYRHQSTHISQLKEGAEKEGYTFEYEAIVENSTDFDKYRKIKADYIGNVGNY